MQPPTFSRLLGLDCLRALAISLVLVSHITFLLFPDSTSTLIDGLRILGAIGVDLFFVLSGYLIGGILLKMIGTDELKWSELFKFWKRRWLRTVPNYFLVLCLNIVVAFLVGMSLPKELFQYSLFLQNFSWGHPDFFTEAWSLSIEEYAYLLLPFLIFFMVISFKNKNKPFLFLLSTVIVIILLTGFKLSYGFNVSLENYHDWSLSFRKVVIYRMDSIYYGFIAVFFTKKFPKYFECNKNVFLILGLVVFVVLHVIIYAFNLLPQSHLWFYVLVYLQMVAFSLMLLFPYFLHLKRTIFGKKIVEFISTRSYAIYLVNYSLVLLNIELLVNLKVLGTIEKILIVLLFLFVTTVVSNVIYLYFERPILKFRDRRFPR
jgi:peptidoglycan/LPS O-acetylase OafA/YrhL